MHWVIGFHSVLVLHQLLQQPTDCSSQPMMLGCYWSLTSVFVCADADSKVNYFEMANNLRTLKVKAPRTMQGHCIAACYWSTPFELLCVYSAAHASNLSAVQLMIFMEVLKGLILSFVHKVQEVLLKLEADIAALPTGQEGYTAPGKFIFELLAKVNLTEETFGFMLQLLEEAMNLLSDEALAAGRKYASSLH